MYNNTSVAGRTRSRKALIEKQNLETKKRSMQDNGTVSSSQPGSGIAEGKRIRGSQEFGSDSVSAFNSHGDEDDVIHIGEGNAVDCDEVRNSERENVPSCKMGLDGRTDVNVQPVPFYYNRDDGFTILGEGEEGEINLDEVISVSSQSDFEPNDKNILEGEAVSLSRVKEEDESGDLGMLEGKNSNFDTMNHYPLDSPVSERRSDDSDHVVSHGSDEEEVSSDEDGDEYAYYPRNEVESAEDFGNKEPIDSVKFKGIEVAVGKMRRVKMFGLDMLLCKDDGNDARTAAQRTRSHYSSKLGKKRKKLGTFSNPLCVDEDQEQGLLSSDSEPDHFDLDDFDDEDDESNHFFSRKTKSNKRRSGCYIGIDNGVHDDKNGNFSNGYGSCAGMSNDIDVGDESDDDHEDLPGGDGVNGIAEEKLSGGKRNGVACAKKVHEKGDAVRPTRKSHTRSPKDYNVIKILQDSLYREEEEPLEKVVSSTEEPVLQLMFSFTEKPKLLEKSEQEIEMDALWLELDRYLNAGKPLPAPAVSPVEDDEDQSPEDGVTRASLCLQGKHHLVLEDDIGLYCKFCSHVELEIKYIVAPFSKNPCGKSDRRDSYAMDHADHSIFNDLQHQTSCDSSYGYDPTGTVWDVIPGVKGTMFPHQCEAFEFLWRNLAGGIVLDELKEQIDFPCGNGCIISHAPGTGKTRLTIVFLQTYMRLYPTCRPMIIAPTSMLLTWEEEFEKWNAGISFHNLNKSEYSGKESEAAMSLLKESGQNVHSVKSVRLLKLYSWKKDRSILGISYVLFEKLAGHSSNDKKLRNFLLKLPGLLVLDEGHTPRNTQTNIWKALSKIETRRRIILSGTPFQNNFDELYNTLCLARPEFAEWNPSDNKIVFCKKQGRTRNETKEKWAHLTNAIGRVSDHTRKWKILKEIRSMIDPFVHVHKGTILQESLPGLRQLVIILRPTQLQKELLEDIQRRRRSLSGENDGFSKNVLKLEYAESLTAVHASLSPLSEHKNNLERLRLNPEDGVKTKFIMRLIQLCEDEKVLVFSQFVNPLTFLTEQLKFHFRWTEGKEVIQMHGKVDVKQRQASIRAFNDPTSKVRVLLASIKACFEGISLVGASRVILLDVVWNPSMERQAVSRAYRLGQKKVVYTYHLITSGTRDEEKCCRQAEKDFISELVFFSSDGDGNGDGHQQNISSADLEDQVLEEMSEDETCHQIFEKIATNKRSLLVWPPSDT